MPFLVGLMSSWPYGTKKERRLELDLFVATKLPGCGIDFLEHLTESGPPVTAQQQLVN